MHEKSLVQSLLKQVEQIRVENGGQSVDQITVEIGPLSGVESELIECAFRELAPQFFSAPPVLNLQNVPLQLRCRSCDLESAVDGLTLQCPNCLSNQVCIIRGDEFRLVDVSMQIPV